MTRIKRLPDWDKKLFAFLLERSSHPFVYGQNDCCMFTCDGILAETGTDLALDWRGLYNDFQSARGLMRSRFKRGLLPAIIAKAREFYIPEIPKEFVMRGDVAVVKHEDEHEGKMVLALGLINDGRITMVNYKGIHSVPLEIGLRFWHIGF